MIKSRIIAIGLLLAMLAAPVIAHASVFSGALYYATILVSNNSTASSNVATTANISTTVLQDGGYLNSSANNCVVRSTAGADVWFMPGYTPNAGLWCFWVPTIGANSYLNYILYTANSTGGEIAYFPGDGGMTISDNATIEPSDNFTIELNDAWINTDNASDKYLFDHYDATNGGIRCFVSPTVSENITASIHVSSNNFSQDAFDSERDLHSGFYERAGQRIDDITFTSITSASFYMEKHQGAPPGTAYCRVWDASDDSVLGTLGSVVADTLGASAWVVFNDDPVGVPFGGDIRIGIEYTAGDGGNRINIAFKDADVTATGKFFWELGDVWTDFPARDCTIRFTYLTDIYVTATGLASGEHDIEVSANVTHFWINVDGGAVENIIALGGVSVPNSTANWMVGDDDVTLYIGEFCIDKDGVEACNIVWEYDNVFYDTSVNDNDATPTFRTASSDADVTAEMTAFSPVSEAIAPDYVLGEAPAFIDADALTGNVTGTFGTTPGTGTGTFPLAGVITAMSNATDTPPQLPLLIIACFIIIAGSLTFSALTRLHGSGSVLIKTIIICCLMGIFVALGNFAIDFWMIVVFAIIAGAMCFASRQLGWA